VAELLRRVGLGCVRSGRGCPRRAAGRGRGVARGDCRDHRGVSAAGRPSAGGGGRPRRAGGPLVWAPPCRPPGHRSLGSPAPLFGFAIGIGFLLLILPGLFLLTIWCLIVPVIVL